MKLSLNWLRQYIQYDLSAEALAQRMTMAGLEVEQITSVGEDIVFDIEITPNRPDCLSILGLAQEVSALLDQELTQPSVKKYSDQNHLNIIIENPEDCSRYIGALIEGVSVQATSKSYATLLESLGLNPISNIVDLSNFVMFEYGQPLHAFDYDKIAGGKVIVRRAKKGETIVTLDDVKRSLDETILVIADEQKPIAIAGIMGGKDTAISSTTKRVFIESACFDMGLIRRASRKLGLSSDSSYRFERGVFDPNVAIACDRMVDLVLQNAHGKVVAKKDVIVKPISMVHKEIIVSYEKIQQVLGCDLETQRMKSILTRLGCQLKVEEKALKVQPPDFRKDLNISEDIIEEIARMIGYDVLPSSLPKVSAHNIPIDYAQESFLQTVTQAMIANGFNEVVLYSLMSQAALEKTGCRQEPIRLQNPMSAEQELMRPSALAGLLQVAAYNMNHGQRDLKIFEVGKKYSMEKESWVLSILMTGEHLPNWKQAQKIKVDFYDLKGVVENIFQAIRLKNATFAPFQHEALEQGQAAVMSIDKTPIGMMGQVATEVLHRFDIKKNRAFFAEIELEEAQDCLHPQERFQEIISFPSMTRDVSLAVPQNTVCLDEMKALCFQQAKGLLKKIDFVERYTGDKITLGCVGYMMSFIYQAHDRTLTDTEVNALHEQLVQSLVTTFGVNRR